MFCHYMGSYIYYYTTDVLQIIMSSYSLSRMLPIYTSIHLPHEGCKLADANPSLGEHYLEVWIGIMIAIKAAEYLAPAH